MPSELITVCRNNSLHAPNSRRGLCFVHISRSGSGVNTCESCKLEDGHKTDYLSTSLVRLSIRTKLIVLDRLTVFSRLRKSKIEQCRRRYLRLQEISETTPISSKYFAWYRLNCLDWITRVTCFNFGL